jgi:sulfur carrier protein
MKVVLRNPRREVEVTGNRRVKEILRELDIIPETVLVIRGDDLVTADQVIGDGDTIELRPVMSGGAEPRAASGLTNEVSGVSEPPPSTPAHPRFKPATRVLS